MWLLRLSGRSLLRSRRPGFRGAADGRRAGGFRRRALVPIVSTPQGSSPVGAPVETRMPTDSFVAPAPVDPTGAAPTQRRNTAPISRRPRPDRGSVGRLVPHHCPAGNACSARRPVMPTPRNGVPAPVPPAPASGGSSDSVPPLNTGTSPFGAGRRPEPRASRRHRPCARSREPRCRPSSDSLHHSTGPLAVGARRLPHRAPRLAASSEVAGPWPGARVFVRRPAQ